MHVRSVVRRSSEPEANPLAVDSASARLNGPFTIYSPNVMAQGLRNKHFFVSIQSSNDIFKRICSQATMAEA